MLSAYACPFVCASIFWVLSWRPVMRAIPVFLWLPAHSDHFAVRHRCHWRAQDEDSEPHQQADADEV
jgi:hypothetical protein